MSADHQKVLEVYLRSALTRTESAAEAIAQQRPYDQDMEKLKILIEMIREQIKDENSSRSTR